MFKKLFDKVDDFVKNFSTINSVNELAKITLEVFEILKQTLSEIFDGSIEENEMLFNEIMESENLFNEICEKAKKARKKKEELLKFLLYLTIIMKEFENRLLEREIQKQRNAMLQKIFEKYIKLIKEVIDSKDLSDNAKSKTIFKLKKSMEKEVGNSTLNKTKFRGIERL